jgi:hypothetical protein
MTANNISGQAFARPRVKKLNAIPFREELVQQKDKSIARMTCP